MVGSLLISIVVWLLINVLVALLCTWMNEMFVGLVSGLVWLFALSVLFPYFVTVGFFPKRCDSYYLTTSRELKFN